MWVRHRTLLWSDTYNEKARARNAQQARVGLFIFATLEIDRNARKTWFCRYFGWLEWSDLDGRERESESDRERGKERQIVENKYKKVTEKWQIMSHWYVCVCCACASDRSRRWQRMKSAMQIQYRVCFQRKWRESSVRVDKIRHANRFIFLLFSFFEMFAAVAAATDLQRWSNCGDAYTQHRTHHTAYIRWS